MSIEASFFVLLMPEIPHVTLEIPHYIVELRHVIL